MIIKGSLMKLGWSETGTSNTSLVFFAKFRSFSCPNESKNSTRDIHPNVWLEDSSVAPPRSVYCHIKQRNGESIHPSIHPSIHRIHPSNPSIESILPKRRLGPEPTAPCRSCSMDRPTPGAPLQSDPVRETRIGSKRRCARGSTAYA